MADSPLIPCANAIAYELNAASVAGRFNREFEANVLWAKRTLRLTELKELRVDLAPINWSKSLVTRGGWGHICRYHLGVRKRFGEAEEDSTGEITDEEITDLVTLLDDLCGFFMPKQTEQESIVLSQMPTAMWTPEQTTDGSPTTEIVINWDHLEEMSQFTGYFPITFEVIT